MDCRDGSCLDSLEGIFDALNHPLRREVLTLLSKNPRRTFRLDAVTDHIAQEGSATEDPDREALKIQLRHVHLPKLAKHDVLEFDPHGGRLRYLPADDVEEWLALIRDWEPE